MKNNILFIILSFSLLSCQHKGDSTKNSTIETIPVFSNYTAELPFSAFVDTIELIPLETTEDNLIGEITRVIFNDGKYYIRSTNGMQNPKLFVFNENGKYIQKISKQGVGPGEYIRFHDFTIANDDHIVLADYKQLLHFDTEGKFLYTSKSEFPRAEGDFALFEILPTKDHAYLGVPLFPQKHLLVKVNDDGSKLDFFFDPGEKEILKSQFLKTWRGLVPSDSCYFLIYSFCDTIYSISPDMQKIASAYYIDYAPKKLPDIPVDPKDDCLSWKKKLSHLDDYLKTSSIGAGDDFLYIGITDKAYKGYLSLYSKHSKKIMTAKKLVDDMYLKGNVITVTGKRIPHNMDGDDIIWEIKPRILMKGYQRLSAADRETLQQKYPAWNQICSSLKEDDNPVLFRIKVKDF